MKISTQGRFCGVIAISVHRQQCTARRKVLRHELSRRIKTRITPRLRFHYDKTNAYGNYMFGLIEKAVNDLPKRESDDEQ